MAMLHHLSSKLFGLLDC